MPEPTREELETALRNADAAGDTDAARQLANALKSGQYAPDPEKAFKQATQDRQAARARANGIEPNFVATPNPENQTGAVQGFAGSVDRFVDSVENYDPQPDAGIKSPADAFLFKGVNALTGGALQRSGNAAFEGTVQEGFGDRAVRASDSFPVGSTAGQMTGMAAQLLPVQRAAGVLKSVPGIKQAVDLAGKSRFGSYAGRLAAGMGAWTGETALQGATTLSDEASAYTGEKPTLESRAGMAKDLATMNLGDAGITTPFVKDVPVNVLGPLGTSFVNRAGVAARTGGASVTPKNVRQSVQESTGRVSGGPEQMRGIAEVIDTELAGGLRPQSIAAVYRILKHSGLSDGAIRALNAEVGQRMQAGSGSAASRKTVGQLYVDILEETKPQAAENILAVLRERRLNVRRNDNSAGIIRSGTRELRDSQKDFLENSANTNLGQNTRIGVREQVEATQKEIGAEYERILSSAPTSGPGADTLRQLILPDPNKSAILSRRAKNAGFIKTNEKGSQVPDVDAYVSARPYEAGHWMRSKLSEASRSAQGAERMVLGNTVDQIDEVLDGFDAYAQTKRNWGTEQGVLNAREFGDRLFGGANSSLMNNPGMRAELVEQFNALTPREQQVALISIRDAALGRMQGGPAGQQARLTSVTSDAAIDFFEQVGAKPFADDLLAIKNEQGFLNSFDPAANSRTAPNQQAVSGAPQLYNSTIANAVDNSTPGTLLGEGALMAFAPHYQGLYAAYRGSRMLANAGFGTRPQTLEDMTRFLMARPGRQAHEAVAASAPGGPLVPTNTPGGALPPPSSPTPAGPGTPPNAGTPGPDFPHVVRHEDGQEWGFKTLREAEEFAAQPAPVPEMPPSSPTPAAAVAASRGGDDVFYHGTGREFDTFDNAYLGSNSGDADSRLGHWLTAERGTAEGFAELAARGPGGQVIPARVSGNLKTVDMQGQKAGRNAGTEQIIRDAKAEGYDGVRFTNYVDAADSGAQPGTSVVVFDAKNIQRVGRPRAGAQSERAGERGMINIDGKPMRRKDALRQVSGEQFPPAPGSATPPPPVTIQAAVEASGSGIMDSPLPYIAGASAIGTGALAFEAARRNNDPMAVGGPTPPESQFMSSMANSAEAAQQAAQRRQADGFPPLPGLKPDLAPVQRAGAQSANQDAKSAESARRHEYYRQLSGPESVVWNKVHQQRAGELKVTPEDRQRGVSRKRLVYGYDIPISELENAPVEELVNGQWQPVAAPVTAR